MKRIISVTLILLFAFATNVSAHTGLTSTSPADGEVLVEDIYEIVLEFDTKIESTSTVKVFNEKNEELVSNAQVNDNVMTSGFMEPLDNGTYTVKWKIIGADGHPMQGTYSFMVSQDELQESIESEETKETPVAPTEEPPEQPVDVSSKIASNDVLVVILVILFTLAGGFFGWIIGRRQK
ncbi:copper resistance CopC family protein [Sporosarcina sp. UB5]|uniref:copper resistance CopC family protein n=1 Tax=Sporosarcina sp. UB5 TaxID=3047463 RepID=UPI003D7B8064